MRTAFELVAWSASRQPQTIAIQNPETGEQLTYAELLARVEDVAGDLALRGVVPGQMFATAMPNTVDHAIVLLALTRLGAVPAVVSPRLKPIEVSQLVRSGGLRGIIEFTHEHDSRLGTSKIDGVENIAISVNRKGGRQSPPAPVFVKPDPNAPAFVFYTSGTTGLPKGVVIPHRAVESRVLFMSTQCGLTFGSHNKALGLMPIHHVIGFFAVFLGSLALNGTWIPISSFEPEKAIDTIQSLGVTCLFASPTHYDALLAAPNFSPENVGSVETVIFAGAAMNDSTLRQLAKSLRVPVINIYGTTETMNSLFSPDTVRDGGGLIPGYHSRVRIAGVGESPAVGLAAGVEGELVVDAGADSVFSHYLNNPQATEEKIVDGWYRSGDAGYVDEDGRVVLTGRIDDMIISGAENVHAEEVELVLSRHPKVADVAVLGLADVRWGEIVAAAVTANDDLTVHELDKFCRDSELANYKRPRKYFCVNHLPRNTAMKVARRVLRDHLERHEGDEADPKTGFVQFVIEEQ